MGHPTVGDIAVGGHTFILILTCHLRLMAHPILPPEGATLMISTALVSTLTFSSRKSSRYIQIYSHHVIKQINIKRLFLIVFQEYSLNKLMETESSLIHQIQDLDSDMQTLVYENYNKFILATDTIRKMKTDFREMEDKMGLLSTNIALIAENSASVSNNLKVSSQN